MHNSVKAIFLVFVLMFSQVPAFAAVRADNLDERNYFQFVIPKYQTQRQGGQLVTVYVRYAYKKGLDESKYFDYRDMRTEVLQFMEPTKEYPVNVYWEILATAIGRDLMKIYPLDGVSVQLNVLDNTNPNSFEPGDHGPTFTIGNITPLDVH